MLLRIVWIFFALLALGCTGGFAPRAAAAEHFNDPDVAKARAASGAEAVTLYRRLVEKYPDSGQLLAELGAVQLDQNDFAAALDSYTRAAKLNWRPDLVYLRIAKCQQRLKNYAAAETAYRTALEHAPDSIAAQFGLAAAQFNQNKSAEALPAFEKLSKRDDEWGKVSKEYLAQAYFDTGKYNESILLVRELLTLNPNDLELRWLLARNLYRTRHYNEAQGLFEQCGKEGRHGEAACFYGAACKECLGNLKEAERDYRDLARANSDFGHEARAAADRIAGKPWYVLINYEGGHDSGIVELDANGTPTQKSDYFNQVFFDGGARVYRSPDFSIWVGTEHFGLFYPVENITDYYYDAGKVVANLTGIGPFNRITFDYVLRYASLDYHTYRRENRFDGSVIYQRGCNRLNFGVSAAENNYYGDSGSLSGPDASIYADYTLQLPLREHLLRVRANADYRWSDDDADVRSTQRVRLQYRSKIWSIIYGQAEGTFRRDDFPMSASAAAGIVRRTDKRWTGELFFDAQATEHVQFNWGILYERQHSTQSVNNYSRTQVSAGFTLTF
jgi:tetratricopeptide (TPR) repeat protein